MAQINPHNCRVSFAGKWRAELSLAPMTGVDQPPRQRTNRGSPMHSTYDQTIEISDLRGKNHMLRWVIAIAAVLTVGHLLFPAAAMTQTVASAEPTVMVN